MRALIIGGSSYIGRLLTYYLLRSGVEVTATSYKRNISNQLSKAKWMNLDVTDRNMVREKLGNFNCDWIFYVSSLAGDTGNPTQMIEVNVNGLQNVLEIFKIKRIKKFVLTSSVCAYDWYPTVEFEEPKYLPIDEKYPANPKDFYGGTKRIQEIIAMIYFNQFDLPVTALRLTVVIGPAPEGDSMGSIVWRKFAKNLKEKKEIQVPHFISEKEVCHLIDIRDAVQMHLIAAQEDRSNGEIFNCCGPSPTSGEEFAKAINENFPKIKLNFENKWSMAQGNELYFDMNKAKKILGFSPIYDILDSMSFIRQWIETGGLDKDKIIYDLIEER